MSTPPGSRTANLSRDSAKERVAPAAGAFSPQAARERKWAGWRNMRYQAVVIYAVGIHLLFLLVVVKSDFISRVQTKLGYDPTTAELAHPEISVHYNKMVRYHTRMEDNVPDDSVIFIGDSITQGLCVSAVATPAVNYGIGGDTTAGLLSRLPVYGSLNRASSIVLAIGVNDLPYRSNEAILSNYKTIVETLPPSVPVVISGVLPLDEKAREEWRNQNRERIAGLNEALAEIARNDPRLYFVDAGPFLTDSEGNLHRDLQYGDGIHLNSKGNEIWIRELRATLDQARGESGEIPSSLVLDESDYSVSDP